MSRFVRNCALGFSFLIIIFKAFTFGDLSIPVPLIPQIDAIDEEWLLDESMEVIFSEEMGSSASFELFEISQLPFSEEEVAFDFLFHKQKLGISCGHHQTYSKVNAECPSYIDPQVWKKVLPYLLPENHPAKPVLDNIFLNTPFRITHNLDSLRDAGFSLSPRQGLRAVVVFHPDLPGYVIKTHIDSFPHSKDDWTHWIKRITGAKMIRKIIKKNGWDSKFKAAKKWIYVLPEKPFSAPGTQCNHFILIAENMDLLPRLESKAKWFQLSDKRVLRCFYKIVSSLGLRDCMRNANAPWSKDGKIAFVDTEDYFHFSVPYVSLNKYLNAEMLEYWIGLTQSNAKN